MASKPKENPKAEAAAEAARPMSRGEFMAKRREELIATGELPAHLADAPAGMGEPVAQSSSEAASRAKAEAAEAASVADAD